MCAPSFRLIIPPRCTHRDTNTDLVDDERGLVPHERVAGVALPPRQLLLLLVLLQGLPVVWERGEGWSVGAAPVHTSTPKPTTHNNTHALLPGAGW